VSLPPSASMACSGTAFIVRSQYWY
jgi:hypothetical protein